MQGASGRPWIVCSDAAQLAAQAAELILQSARESIRARGKFTIALAGGSTPKATYDLLASAKPAEQLDWSRSFFFFGDERYVPHDDPRSNYHMVRESLLQAAVPEQNVFAVPTGLPTVDECANAYARTLRQFFGDATMPVFDLILLGLGDDGHTASLFPHASALEVDHVAVTSSPPGVLPPPVDRITLTYPAINAARHVLFLVAGANKAQPLAEVLSGKANLHDRPAAGVRPEQGQLIWLVDRAAANLLPAA